MCWCGRWYFPERITEAEVELWTRRKRWIPFDCSKYVLVPGKLSVFHVYCNCFQFAHSNNISSCSSTCWWLWIIEEIEIPKDNNNLWAHVVLRSHRRRPRNKQKFSKRNKLHRHFIENSVENVKLEKESIIRKGRGRTIFSFLWKEC